MNDNILAVLETKVEKLVCAYRQLQGCYQSLEKYCRTLECGVKRTIQRLRDTDIGAQDDAREPELPLAGKW